MSDLDDIIGSLAKKYNGNMLDDETKKKEEKKPAPRSYDLGDFDDAPRRTSSSSGGSFENGTKLFPSERMALRHMTSDIIMPKRAAVLISVFPDDELQWMMDTPAKRTWSFQDWLEVIGLPRDLHEKHDFTIYPLMARTFLKRKDEAHRK
jgi:hypothetical protein